MIGRLSGTTISVLGFQALIDVSGVGYEVLCTRQAALGLEPGKNAVLLIHTDVREDAITLCGFGSELERSTFRLLLKVSGIGVKTALDILTKTDSKDLLMSIASSDLQALTAIKGLGKKTAERIILELREKVFEHIDSKEEVKKSSGFNSHEEDAISALTGLGISRKEAERALEKVKSSGEVPGDAEGVIKEALRWI